MKPDILLSIVTPTYNRGWLLEKCFASLQAQTDPRFEWIIVDDGSTDNTAEIATAFPAAAPELSICYVRKENGGKHTALNASHPYVHGKYVLILDSDDTLTENAVELALKNWAKWEDRNDVGIVTLLKGRDREHPNCYGEKENTPVDIIAGQRIRPVSNDACEVIRTELFLRYPFPVFPGERFISEGALWNRVAATHQCVYVNKVIYLCTYLEDGLTYAGKSLRVRCPRGGMFTNNLNMSSKNKMKRRLKSGILYTCYGCFAGMSLRQMAVGCDHKVLMTFSIIPGVILYAIWSRKYARD